MKTHQDPLIEEVRRARMELSAQFGHDLRKLGAFLREEEKRHPQRLAAHKQARRAKKTRSPRAHGKTTAAL
jgi:hypothetical protein